MTNQVSAERKVAYYLGMVLMVIGGLLFFSIFVSAAVNFGNAHTIESNARSSISRAVLGMTLLILGRFIRSVGARGLAGSGVVLDPGRARSELEPYARMAGGMVKDALEETDIKLGNNESEKIVMIKCRACGKLNEEDSKFCQECGKPI